MYFLVHRDSLDSPTHLSVPGGATIVTQMRVNGVQQERNKKGKVERRRDFPVYALVRDAQKSPRWL